MPLLPAEVMRQSAFRSKSRGVPPRQKSEAINGRRPLTVDSMTSYAIIGAMSPNRGVESAARNPEFQRLIRLQTEAFARNTPYHSLELLDGTVIPGIIPVPN